jgi:SAM-dependent methyltransferase
MDIKETDILGDSIWNHFYYCHKAAMTKSLLGNINGQKILDVGAGSGFFSKYLLRYTGAASAVCVDVGYEKEYGSKLDGKQIQFVKSVEKSDADIVLMMDVCEHIEDDLIFLHSYQEKVKIGTKFLITVPAFQFLWSGHDVYLEHYRRYTLRQLETVVRKAGLTPVKGCYLFANIFPLACVKRYLFPHKNEPKSDLQKYSPFVNSILSAVCCIENLYFRYNHLAGLTVCIVAESGIKEPALTPCASPFP